MKADISTDKVHLVIEEDRIRSLDFGTTACGWGYLYSPHRKILTMDYKKVTCGNCKRTGKFFGERNKNE